MKKYYFVILIALFLQGCSKNDDLMAGKGEIRHDRQVYKLENVYHRIFEELGVTNDDTPYVSYCHALIFTGKNWKTMIRVMIRSEKNEIESGEYHAGQVRIISNEYNSIQMEINLADDFVHFATYYDPAKRKMHLSYTQKSEDTFEIELKYLDEESVFLVKWDGIVKDKWW